MKVLGLSPFHDSSVTLINDGIIEKYYKEERLNREKRSSFPEMSLKKCLEDVDNLDAFAYSAAAHKIIFPSREEDFQPFFNLWKSKVQNIVKVSEIVDMSRMHHYQHAASSFYASGFEDAAVVVVDGRGSYFGTIAETETIFYASYPDNFIPVYKAYEKAFNFKDVDVDIERRRLPDCEIKVSSNLGITHLYCTATHLINQSFLENGKTMGLSAYGDRSIDYENLLIPDEALVDPEKFIDIEIDNSVDSIFAITYYKDYVGLQNNVTTDNYQLYANYALHVQRETEKALEILINKAIEKTGCKNICLSGGYGLNVVNNYRLLKKFPGIKFFFDPMSDDGGTSIGGAMLSYRNLTKDKKLHPIQNNFIHGVEHDLSRISGRDVSIEDISKLLLNNKIIAMYYGLAEGGPRALGNRSILFNPTVLNGKEIVNRVKKREWYRPFAASMLEEEASKYFEYIGNVGYEYMTINAMAKQGTREKLPAIVHEDGSCRIHIVKDKNHPLFKLLKDFKEKSGIGVLLNTSFNLAGQPLVETPDEAIGTWKISDIDALWFPKISKALI